MIDLKKQQLECKSFLSNNNSKINNETTINNEEPLDDELLMIRNIWNNFSRNNKKSLISDILNKSIINIMNDDYWMMI